MQAFIYISCHAVHRRGVRIFLPFHRRRDGMSWSSCCRMISSSLPQRTHHSRCTQDNNIRQCSDATNKNRKRSLSLPRRLAVSLHETPFQNFVRGASSNGSNNPSSAPSPRRSSSSRNRNDVPSKPSKELPPHNRVWWKDNPYARLARLDKPIGTWLLFWPCAWSTAIAATAGHLPEALLVTQFGVGAFLMRGAGCTINDMWDADIDGKVHRTKTRPLASGELSYRQALQFLTLQLSAGLALLLSLPNTWYCVKWGLASMPLVVLYPATKRFFAAPQLILGLTFNWGAFMGYAALHGTMDYNLILPLYGSGVTWTLLYDTIYAHQDKQYDRQLGLNSTALTFGSTDAGQKAILHALATLTYLQWLCVVGQSIDPSTFVPQQQSWLWWGSSVGGLTAAYSHLIWQVHTADFDNPQNCLERFQSNTTVGAIVFGSLAACQFLATPAAL